MATADEGATPAATTAPEIRRTEIDLIIFFMQAPFELAIPRMTHELKKYLCESCEFDVKFGAL